MIYYKKLWNKEIYIALVRSRSIHLNELLLRTVILKLWSFTLDFTLSLSIYIMHLPPTNTENPMTEVRLGQPLAFTVSPGTPVSMSWLLLAGSPAGVSLTAVGFPSVCCAMG